VDVGNWTKIPSQMISGWFSRLITVVLKKIKYPLLICNHDSQNIWKRSNDILENCQCFFWPVLFMKRFFEVSEIPKAGVSLILICFQNRGACGALILNYLKVWNLQLHTKIKYPLNTWKFPTLFEHVLTSSVLQI
jgi:hypothetical protein